MTPTINPTDIMFAVGRGDLDGDLEIRSLACAYLARECLATTGYPLVDGASHEALSAAAVEDVAFTCREVTRLIDSGALPHPTAPNAEAISERYFAGLMGGET